MHKRPRVKNGVDYPDPPISQSPHRSTNASPQVKTWQKSWPLDHFLSTHYFHFPICFCLFIISYICSHCFTSPFPPSSLLFPLISPDTWPCPPKSPFVIGSPPPLSLCRGLPAARSPPKSTPSPMSGFRSLWAESAAAPPPHPPHPSPLCQVLHTAWANICPPPCQPVPCLPSVAAPTASPPWLLPPHLFTPALSTPALLGHPVPHLHSTSRRGLPPFSTLSPPVPQPESLWGCWAWGLAYWGQQAGSGVSGRGWGWNRQGWQPPQGSLQQEHSPAEVSSAWCGVFVKGAHHMVPKLKGGHCLHRHEL